MKHAVPELPEAPPDGVFKYPYINSPSTTKSLGLYASNASIQQAKQTRRLTHKVVKRRVCHGFSDYLPA
jgi:hypothetical protein